MDIGITLLKIYHDLTSLLSLTIGTGEDAKFTFLALVLLILVGGALGGLGSYLIGDRKVKSGEAESEIDVQSLRYEIGIGIVGAMASVFLLEAARLMPENATPQTALTFLSFMTAIGFAARRLLRIIAAAVTTRFQKLVDDVEKVQKENKDAQAALNRAKDIAAIEAGLQPGAVATQRAEAQRLLKQYEEREPDNAQIIHLRATAYFNQDKKAEAKTTITAFLDGPGKTQTGKQIALLYYVRACFEACEDTPDEANIKADLTKAIAQDASLKQTAPDDEDLTAFTDKGWFQELVAA